MCVCVWAIHLNLTKPIHALEFDVVADRRRADLILKFSGPTIVDLFVSLVNSIGLAFLEMGLHGLRGTK